MSNLSKEFELLLGHAAFRLWPDLPRDMQENSLRQLFRPLQPSRIQPPHPTLAATRCAAHPETSTIPAEYSCEKP